MRREALMVTAALAMYGATAAEPAAEATVTVDLSKPIGPVRIMNAVNNGPSVKKPGAVFVTRYSDDDNSSESAKVTVRMPGKDLSKVRCHMTDLIRTYTEVPVELQADGSVVIQMQPLSFALVEW